jgi:hypothetical protein
MQRAAAGQDSTWYGHLSFSFSFEAPDLSVAQSSRDEIGSGQAAPLLDMPPLVEIEYNLSSLEIYSLSEEVFNLCRSANTLAYGLCIGR